MKFQDGDLLACFGRDRGARLISLGTASLLAPPRLRLGPSHVGIILDGRLFESTSKSPRPCEHMGRVVAGIQRHTPESRIADYTSAGGRVDVYRLTDLWDLDWDEVDLLNEQLERMLATGRVYDLFGAALSGTRLFQWSRLFPTADLDSLFCSELVAALLMRTGRLGIGNAGRFNPGRLLRRLVRTGIYRFHRTHEGLICAV
ncbi:MAG: hypothetical protein KF774_17850 [Planctomyces sp.]|nr:hypothetical protein [Planctomyces sp.]